MIDQIFNVKDRVVFITGAFGLIGKEISAAFLSCGAHVVMADLSYTGQPLEDEALAAFAEQGALLPLHLDITKEDSIQQAVDATVARFGKLDVLINNAAIDAKFDQSQSTSVNPSRFEHYPAELLRKSVEVNLTGTVLMTQIACRQMLAQGSGNIINVASTYSVVSPNQSLYDFGEGIKAFKPVDYVASKSFVPNFTRYLATFYAPNGIRCNAIVPHAIDNNHPEHFKKNFARMSPLGRMSDRSELNGPFIFLASDASSYVTGATLMVDGGWTAW